MRKGWNKWPVHVRNVEYRFGFRKRPMDWALSKHKEIERYTPLLMARTQLLSNARHFLYSFLFEIRSVHKTRSWSKENGILMRLLSLYDERWGVEWFTKKAPTHPLLNLRGNDKNKRERQTLGKGGDVWERWNWKHLRLVFLCLHVGLTFCALAIRNMTQPTKHVPTSDLSTSINKNERHF